jgi:hypothetical protein
MDHRGNPEEHNRGEENCVSNVDLLFIFIYGFSALAFLLVSHFHITWKNQRRILSVAEGEENNLRERLPALKGIV